MKNNFRIFFCNKRKNTISNSNGLYLGTLQTEMYHELSLKYFRNMTSGELIPPDTKVNYKCIIMKILYSYKNREYNMEYKNEKSMNYNR